MTFKEIGNYNIPFNFVELSKAPTPKGLVKQDYKVLLVGQKTAGTAETNKVLKIFGTDEADLKFGENSMMASQCRAYFAANKSVELNCIALDDLSTGTQASGNIEIVGTATENGTLAIYINGKSYATPIAVGDTPTDITTKIKATIDADNKAMFGAVVNGKDLELTAVHKGAIGNEIIIVKNYNIDDVNVGGVIANLTQFTGGVGNPNIDFVVETIENKQYNIISVPYTDNATITTINTALNDNWKATEMLDGINIVAVNDTVTNLTTKTASLNNLTSTILDGVQGFKTGAEIAANLIGTGADISQADPTAPWSGLELVGILPLDNRIRTERNVLSGNGVATLVRNGNKLYADRIVTTLVKDKFGVSIPPDETDLRLFLALSYVRYAFATKISTYRNWKLGGDDDRFKAGIKVMTPSYYRTQLINIYEVLVENGICENQKEFNDSIIVERDGNRLNSTFKVNVINVSLQLATKIEWEV